MKCPVCGKEARTRIYKCAKCGVYVHVACWEKHLQMAHSGQMPSSAKKR
jgi:ribosomal protein L37AE/L43A